ncbi:MAG: patatin-like phospholipase family protein [Nevskiales bacterium]
MDFSSSLAQTPLFASLGDDALQRLAAIAELHDLHSGQCLYLEGEPPAYFHIVLSGRLRVTSHGVLLGYVSRLEPVGEMGVITGEPRSASVHAVRDSLILRIPGVALLELLNQNAPALMAVTRLVIARLRQYQGQRRPAATESQGSFAIVPASSNVPTTVLAEALVQCLSGWPKARLITAAHVDAALGPGTAQTPLTDSEDDRRLRAWLNRLEGRHRYVIYAADGSGATWSQRCLRQADRVLVLAEAHLPPADTAMLRALREGGLLAPIELVLLRPEGDPSPHTLAWRERTGARAHYYVHPWDEQDLAALARQVTGRGVGLVLGGGGARGFAHIGLLRALEQLEIPVDIAGGTSMGAFISALLACGFDSVEIAHITRETFVKRNNLNDYVVPRVSLIRAQKFLARLVEIFGERQVEALRRSYYCISTNLTTGAPVVHDRGRLAYWVGTSMAVPGIVPPIAYEGELLCDGGVVNNLPTDVMQNLERGSIIACNVSTEGDIRAPGAGIGQPDPQALLHWKGAGPSPRLAEILFRTATLTSDTAKQRESAGRADIYLRMPIQDIRMFDWHRLDELVERGYQHALKELTPLRDRLPR